MLVMIAPEPTTSYATAMTSVPQIFDRSALKLRLARARRRGPADFLLVRAAEDLGDRLATIQRSFADCLDLGTPGTIAAELLRARPGTRNVTHITCEDETSPVDLENPGLNEAAYECVVSLLALHNINDLPGLLTQIRRALRPDGLFMAALIGGDTLTELRTALMEAELETTGGAALRVAPFADVRSLGQLLQRAGFALPVADSERITVRYASALDLMIDLRDMGATNILTDRPRNPLRRSTLFRAAEIYAERFADAGGRLRATFEIVWLSGWAPHASQQQPLKPGSAKMKLADALRALTPDDAGKDTP